jgi:CBS domain-containing protein
MAISVREIMTADPIRLASTTSIRDAARAMRDNNIGDVVVEKDGHLCGIVTDRDIVVRAVAENKDPVKTTLESICTKEVTSISPDQTDDDAVRLMRERAVRRLPVIEKGTVVGIVSLGDLAVKKDPKSALGRISAAAGNL